MEKCRCQALVQTQGKKEVQADKNHEKRWTEIQETTQMEASYLAQSYLLTNSQERALLRRRKNEVLPDFLIIVTWNQLRSARTVKNTCHQRAQVWTRFSSESLKNHLLMIMKNLCLFLNEVLVQLVIKVRKKKLRFEGVNILISHQK